MNKQVLIVEDDLSTQLVLEGLIRKIDPDTDVDATTSAESAYRLLSDAGVGRPGYDLVVADYGLPGSNGLVLWDLCAKRYPGLEFLFVSGVTHEEWFHKTKDLADWPVLIRKPVEEYELKRFWDQRFGAIGEAAS